jgi:hypothetical protein
MKTAYSLDFSKCYYFEPDSYYYKDYTKLLGINEYFYISENSISLVQGDYKIAHLDLDTDRYTKDFYEKLQKLKFDLTFDELLK